MKTKKIDIQQYRKYENSMKKSIQDYLPEKNSSVAFTARVPKTLLAEVKAICHKENRTFTEVITACLTKFVDEMRNRKKSA